MISNKTIGVVVPAYNEEYLIERTIHSIPEYIDKIIIVDDCSVDLTNEIVKRLSDEQPNRIINITHTENQGVGGAIASGYTWCRDNELDIAVVMAGDSQMDPADLPDLIKPIVKGVCDFAKGNRLITGDAWNKIPKIRYLGNSLMSLLTKIASGYWHVADSQSGYTAANLKVLKTIDWSKMYKRYGQPNDLLVRLNIYNFRVKDVPVKPIYNIGEKSGIRPLLMIPKLFFLLIKLFFFRLWQKYVIRDFHPLVFFYLMAISLFGISIPLGLRALYYWLILGLSIPPTNALAWMTSVIAGFQALFFAMWFDMEYNLGLGK